MNVWTVTEAEAQDVAADVLGDAIQRLSAQRDSYRVCLDSIEAIASFARKYPNERALDMILDTIREARLRGKR